MSNPGIDPADHARAAIFTLAVLEFDQAGIDAIMSADDECLAPALATLLAAQLVNAHGVDGAARMLDGIASGFAAAAVEEA